MAPQTTTDEAQQDQTPAPVPPAPAPTAGPDRPLARVTANATVIHGVHGEQADAVLSSRDGRWTRLLWTDEQPYRREVKVGPEWEQLPLGWVGESAHPPALLAVVNREDPNRSPLGGIPTPEVKAAGLARIVEVGVRPESGVPVSGFARVRPYEETHWEPVPGATYFLRCTGGHAKVVVVAVPGDGR